MSYIGVDILDSIVDLNDYNNPIKKQVQTSYSISSTNIYKEINIFLKSGKVLTDRGWLMEDVNEISYLKIDKEKEFSREILPDEHTIARFNLRMSNLEEVFQRKYDKIQDVAANVGNKCSRLLFINILNYNKNNFFFFFKKIVLFLYRSNHANDHSDRWNLHRFIGHQ